MLEENEEEESEKLARAQIEEDKPEKAPRPKELKGEAIVTKCFFNKRGMCYCISNSPEPLDCPCPHFVCYDKECIKRFEEMTEEFQCKTKLKTVKPITYYELMLLLKYRMKSGGNSGEKRVSTSQMTFG